MTNRKQYDEAVADLTNHLDRGETVEILTGPCAPLVVKDSTSLREYKRRLWTWLTAPQPLSPYVAR